MRFLMVYALLRCHVRNTLKRGAFWRPSGPDTPARFTPRATWSSLELTRVGDHCGPGRHQEFFFGPTKRHCIRPGVAGGRGAATMARGALETGKPGDIAELHFKWDYRQNCVSYYDCRSTRTKFSTSCTGSNGEKIREGGCHETTLNLRASKISE